MPSLSRCGWFQYSYFFSAVGEHRAESASVSPLCQNGEQHRDHRTEVIVRITMITFFQNISRYHHDNDDHDWYWWSWSSFIEETAAQLAAATWARWPTWTLRRWNYIFFYHKQVNKRDRSKDWFLILKEYRVHLIFISHFVYSFYQVSIVFKVTDGPFYGHLFVEDEVGATLDICIFLMSPSIDLPNHIHIFNPNKFVQENSNMHYAICKQNCELYLYF